MAAQGSDHFIHFPALPRRLSKIDLRISLSRSVQIIVLIWLAWVMILVNFQELVSRRFVPWLPDTALIWTLFDGMPLTQNNRPYLLEPFLNSHVSWDSEFYLSITVAGYDDPQVRAVTTPDGEVLSLSYAYFPFYPLLTRAVAYPLRILHLSAVGTATLAGVIVSMLGALGGMLSLYDLTRDHLGDGGGIRTAFYLLIFPTGFFLAQVYTEGLFIGLSFGCLALLGRRHLVMAALLAACATWTRAVGGLLVVPLAIAWLKVIYEYIHIGKPIPRQAWLKGLYVLLPAAAYLVWSAVYGPQFKDVESLFFQRGLFLVGRSLRGWWMGLKLIVAGINSQTTSYYLLEFGSIALALVASLYTLRRYPGLTLFSLGVFVVSVMSGSPQSMIRYIIAMPSIFVFLSHLGRHTVFDRVWTLSSVLILGMLVTLFTFDMWVG